MTSTCDMVLVGSNDDIVLVVKNFCIKCANEKLDILKIFQITIESENELKKLGVRGYNIKCICNKK